MNHFSAGSTRSSLLTRVRDKDSEAWGEMVELYGPLVSHWCKRKGLDTHATADCIQDVFSAVLRSLEKFQPKRESGAFRAWLWTITSNKIKDRFRSDARQTAATGGSTALRMLQDVESDSNDEQPSGRMEEMQLSHRAMLQVRDEFTQRSWQVFERNVIDGQSSDVVADQFGMSQAAVRKIRSRILRRIRQQLGDL